jgi:cysteine-rich repeat protein
MRTSAPRAALALGVLLGAVSLAQAHEAKVGMATESLVFKAAGKPKFAFKGFSDTLTPNAAEDPAEVGAGLLVRAEGPGGSGRSALVVLDPARWKAREKDGVLRYVYKDKAGKRGGVRQVVFERGRLAIKAGGAAFPWSGDGSPEHVEVMFRLGQEWHCASATGTTTTRGFRAKNQFAPTGCAPLVCGDGIRQLGEGCDDGNVDEADACTNACVRGACNQQSFGSSWEALHAIVIEGHGCTQEACHGSAAEGGLDLRFEHAYDNLLEVPSTGSPELRINPGGPRRSFLWLKLAAKTDPGSVEITGTAMPSGLPPIGEDELEALRLWIYAGAPEDGVVDGVQDLLDACLPEPTPLEIEPLDPPAPDAGIQFRMPEFPLPANSETEVCFAQYYDFSASIPPQFLTPDGTRFYTNGAELRQDPHSHHLQIIYIDMPVERLSDPVFGAWTCKGGALEGQPCEPTDLSACGTDGLCGSAPTPSIACIGYGPPEYSPGILGSIVGGAQTAQSYQPAIPGFWNTLPVKGVLYWNSHAFNLTAGDTRMHAYDNHLFTGDLRYQQHAIQNIGTVYYAAGTPPFTERTVCEDTELPQGARLMFLNSHTHKRGRRFWVELQDGEIIYENFSYSDPAVAAFDPPRLFDSTDPLQRTLRYCATYNNGVAANGAPDPATVRRHSVTPSNGSPCQPVACVAGRIGAACAGPSDDATCDSTPGAGDGWCDACPITAGVTTEDEMFLLFGGYVMVPVE